MKAVDNWQKDDQPHDDEQSSGRHRASQVEYGRMTDVVFSYVIAALLILASACLAMAVYWLVTL